MNIPERKDNPDGLYRRYEVRYADGSAPDPMAEYFVLRLDPYGDDPDHIAACRSAIRHYAEAIKDHLPGLSSDLLARYPAAPKPKEK